MGEKEEEWADTVNIQRIARICAVISAEKFIANTLLAKQDDDLIRQYADNGNNVSIFATDTIRETLEQKMLCKSLPLPYRGKHDVNDPGPICRCEKLTIPLPTNERTETAVRGFLQARLQSHVIADAGGAGNCGYYSVILALFWQGVYRFRDVLTYSQSEEEREFALYSIKGYCEKFYNKYPSLADFRERLQCPGREWADVAELVQLPLPITVVNYTRVMGNVQRAGTPFSSASNDNQPLFFPPLADFTGRLIILNHGGQHFQALLPFEDYGASLYLLQICARFIDEVWDNHNDRNHPFPGLAQSLNGNLPYFMYGEPVVDPTESAEETITYINNSLVHGSNRAIEVTRTFVNSFWGYGSEFLRPVVLSG